MSPGDAHGRCLADRLAEGPLPLHEALRVSVEVAEALVSAHARGVRHRALEPSSVLLRGDGRVELLDPGRTGRGAPGYTAPEVEAGLPGDERSDVYSLGMVVRDLVPDAPPTRLVRLVDHLTATDPADRPASGVEALSDLLVLQQALEPGRRPWRSAVITAAGVVGLVVIALVKPPPPPPRPPPSVAPSAPPVEPFAQPWAALGQLRGAQSLEAARPILDRAVASPLLSPGEAVELLTALGRLDEALARARRFVAATPGAPAERLLALVHRRRGEPAAALAAERRARALLPGPPGWSSRLTYLEADALDELAALASPSLHRDPAWLALRGRWREALRALDAAAPGIAASDEERAWHHLLRAGYLAYGLGDVDGAWREVAPDLDRGFTAAHVLAVPLAASGDAILAASALGVAATPDGQVRRARDAFGRWWQGDREGALAELDELYGLGSWLARGELLLELGRDREAVEALRRARRLADFPFADLRDLPAMVAAGYPRSLYLEAVSLDRLGERDEARAVLGRLLRLWDRADPDLPLTRDMHALERRLAAGGG